MMRSITVLGVLVGGALLIGTGSAAAQGSGPFETAYAHINVGGQSGSHDLTQQGSFPQYDEAALFTSTTSVGGSPIFDIGGGYRVWGERLYAGISITHAADKSNANVTGSIPHPKFFDQFRAVTGQAMGLEHSDTGFHLQAVYRVPVTTKFDVAISVGPSIFNVSQEVVQGLTIAEQGDPTTGVVLTGVTKEKVKDTTVGFNIGVDGTYLFTERLGAGAFLRWAGASAEIEGSAGTVKLDVGGVQIGAGLRLRF
jgi:hypothetical protein